METSTLIESFKIAPALAALVVVVYLFIKAQQWMIKHNEQVGKERIGIFSETIKAMHADHLEARELSREAMVRVSIAETQLSGTMARVESALVQCAEAHRRHNP